MQTVYTETEPMGTVKARIFNYGANPVSNFDISYQLDNGDVVTETFNGSISSWGYSDHTFSTQFDSSSWEQNQFYTLCVL